MSQKSDHYLAYGVISIIIQGMRDMKIIYLPYGNSKPCQEYQYVLDVKIDNIRHLHSFSFALLLICLTMSKKISIVYWSR